jgi:hypothetical protein
LKASELVVTIKDKGTLTSKDVGSKILPLSEVIDVCFAKADMVIHRKDGGPKKVQMEDDDDEAFDKDA